jgi:chlorobactene glucosyltransferase
VVEFAEALVPAVPWLAPFLAFFRLARRTPALRDAPAVQGRLVSIIVPARNEAANLPTLLDSLLASNYNPLEILVVNDRSTDATAAITTAYAQRDPRVQLIPGEILAAGWYGKPWACLQGYRAAAGDLLLFTDADTRHAPELLAHAVGALDHERADLVSVLPRLVCGSFWERAVMPLMFATLGFRFHPRRVNRARHARDMIANGQFILVTREAYLAVGTHAVVRHEVAEDLMLAQAFFRAGRRWYLAYAVDLLETRMYTSLRDLLTGWTKNVYVGGRRSYPDEPIRRAMVPAMFFLNALFWLLPPALLLLGALGAVAATWLVPASVATGLCVAFWALFDAGFGVSPLYALTYPLGQAVIAWIFLRSTFRGERRIEWRGRTYGPL